MGAASSAVITTERLTRVFGATTAVNELSLTIEAGEVFGFLGHNGAGKTTTAAPAPACSPRRLPSTIA